MLIVLFEGNPKIFVTADLIKINRTMSYMTFIVKDIKEFAFQKHTDGTFYEEIRFANKRIKELKQEIFMSN